MTVITRVDFERRVHVIYPRRSWHPIRQWVRWLATIYGRGI